MTIFVGPPSYDRRLHHGYVHALLGTADALRDRSIAAATSRVFCQRWSIGLGGGIPTPAVSPSAAAKLPVGRRELVHPVDHEPVGGVGPGEDFRPGGAQA